MKYWISKEVEADSIEEAILKEKKAPIDSIEVIEKPDTPIQIGYGKRNNVV